MAGANGTGSLDLPMRPIKSRWRLIRTSCQEGFERRWILRPPVTHMTVKRRFFCTFHATPLDVWPSSNSSLARLLRRTDMLCRLMSLPDRIGTCAHKAQLHVVDAAVNRDSESARQPLPCASWQRGPRGADALSAAACNVSRSTIGRLRSPGASL